MLSRCRWRGCAPARGELGRHTRGCAPARGELGRHATHFCITRHAASASDSTPLLLHLYEEMLRIRLFEQRCVELFDRKFVKGTAHSCEGQEATAVGVCGGGLLTERDFVLSHHRGHGHVLAKGADMGRCLAELGGRRDGYCGGMGGSMHLADLSKGVLGANGVVGASLALGCGAGLAAKYEGKGRVAVAFFGDGASNQGLFLEASSPAPAPLPPSAADCRLSPPD